MIQSLTVNWYYWPTCRHLDKQIIPSYLALSSLDCAIVFSSSCSVFPFASLCFDSYSSLDLFNTSCIIASSSMLGAGGRGALDEATGTGIGIWVGIGIGIGIWTLCRVWRSCNACNCSSTFFWIINLLNTSKSSAAHIWSNTSFVTWKETINQKITSEN